MTTRANEVEPFEYLSEVFEKLPAAMTVEVVEALLPWNLQPVLDARRKRGSTPHSRSPQPDPCLQLDLPALGSNDVVTGVLTTDATVCNMRLVPRSESNWLLRRRNCWVRALRFELIPAKLPTGSICGGVLPSATDYIASATVWNTQRVAQRLPGNRHLSS